MFLVDEPKVLPRDVPEARRAMIFRIMSYRVRASSISNPQSIAIASFFRVKLTDLEEAAIPRRDGLPCFCEGAHGSVQAAFAAAG